MTPEELEIHQRHFLNSKDKREFIEKLHDSLPGNPEDLKKKISKKSKIEWIKLGDNEELYAINDKLAFWLKNDEIIPLISYMLEHELPFKSIVVDEGAIKFVAKGADVMRPGIIHIDKEIQKGDIVLIRDPNHNKVLAIGKAKYDANVMESMKKGKVLDSIHNLADQIWAFSKNFS